MGESNIDSGWAVPQPDRHLQHLGSEVPVAVPPTAHWSASTRVDAHLDLLNERLQAHGRLDRPCETGGSSL